MRQNAQILEPAMRQSTFPTTYHTYLLCPETKCQTDEKNRKKRIESFYKARKITQCGDPTPSENCSRKTATG